MDMWGKITQVERIAGAKTLRQGEHLDRNTFVSSIKSTNSILTKIIRYNFTPRQVTKMKSSRIQGLENVYGIGSSQVLLTEVEMCVAERQWQGEQVGGDCR